MIITSESTSTVEILPAAECWQLLGKTGFGRLATVSGGDVGIFPLNYVVTGQRIYFRSAPGSKLVDITAHPSIALEVDGVHRQSRWSVVVKGWAERLGTDDEIVDSGVLDLETFDPSAKWNYVRITPIEVSGRRFISFAPDCDATH